MIRLHGRKACFCILAVIFYLVVPLIADGAVEDMLAELNAKSPEERQKIITENAKKEGEVTLYTAVNMRDAQELIAGFNKSYPGIRVAISSLGGPGVLNKVLTEYRAGAYLADVVALNGISSSRMRASSVRASGQSTSTRLSAGSRRYICTDPSGSSYIAEKNALSSRSRSSRARQ